jgi:uncharacterized membrane protein
MADEQNAAPAPAPSTGGAPTSDEKVMAALSYLGILFLIPLLAKKDSKFAMFHAKQGLVLFILEIILWIIEWVLAFSIVGILFIGWIIWIIWIVLAIFSLIGLIQAFSGNYWKMPILAGWAASFKF